MTRYWFLIRVQLGKPMDIYDEEGVSIVERHTHYKQYFGVTMESSDLALESVKKLLRSKGDAFEALEEIRENVELGLMNEAVQKAARDPGASGVWYQSGRLLLGTSR